MRSDTEREYRSRMKRQNKIPVDRHCVPNVFHIPKHTTKCLLICRHQRPCDQNRTQSIVVTHKIRMYVPTHAITQNNKKDKYSYKTKERTSWSHFRPDPFPPRRSAEYERKKSEYPHTTHSSHALTPRSTKYWPRLSSEESRNRQGPGGCHRHAR